MAAVVGGIVAIFFAVPYLRTSGKNSFRRAAKRGQENLRGSENAAS